MYRTHDAHNDWLLLVTRDEDEEREDKEAITQAGWPASCILTATADEAASLLYGRLHDERTKRPGVIIVDLDHAGGENRDRLKRLMKDIKDDPELHSIPLIMLLRGDFIQEDVNAWYKQGVNAVALRPNSPDEAVHFYKSLRTFWQERVLLPEPEWP